MKQDSPYPLRLDQTLKRKLQKIAKDNDRSFRAQIENILKKYVSEYEHNYGEISIDDLSGRR